jgi:CheY-like chemotaxis protein
VTNLQLVHQVRGLAGNARLIVTADDRASAERLYGAGADYVVVTPVVTAEHLQQALGDGSARALARARRRQATRLFGR